MNATVEQFSWLKGERLLYACVGVSMLVHALAMLYAAPVKPKDPPPPRITATLRAAPPPAPVANTPVAPPAAEARKPEPPAETPKPQATPPKPEAKPTPQPEAKAAPVKPTEKQDSRPTVAAAPTAPAPATATPAPAPSAAPEAKAEPRSESRVERDAPKVASAAPSSTTATSEDDKLALGLFQEKLVSIIETRKLKRYPNEAMQNGWEGTAWVELMVGSDGKTRGINIRNSSGHDILDREARIAVEKARMEAIMQMPPALRGKDFNAQIRVVFKLP